TDLIASDTAPDAPAAADLAEIRAAGERAADLTRQLLLFSRQQVLAPQVLDPNAVLAQLDKMLRRLLGEDIDLVTATRATRHVRIDRGSLEQVVMNLVVNARDAMPEGGQLTLETADVELDDADARTHL